MTSSIDIINYYIPKTFSSEIDEYMSIKLWRRVEWRNFDGLLKEYDQKGNIIRADLYHNGKLLRLSTTYLFI